MSKATSSATGDRRTMHLALGGIIGSGLLATLAFGLLLNAQTETADQLQQTNAKLSDLADAINTSSGQQTRNTDLVAAVDQVMQQRAQAEQEAQRQALLEGYDNAPTDLEDDTPWTYGDADARFTLYTYSDPNCPYCRQFHNTPKQLVDSSQGVMKAQYHHMTIMDANSTTQALASECAGRLGDNQHFWALNDYIYENHQVREAGLLDVAETMGFDRSAFRQCMQSSDVQRHVAVLGREAQSEGVTGTPTSFLIDNETGEEVRLSGAQPPGAIISALRGMIEQESAEAGTANGQPAEQEG
ncbi:DsbA family protein [Vreelandella alkaliphila]|uniref:Thioredoxin-like fold domain-containing protein n=1 Tax=Halomonas campaniensis TaxID=213554 RepID=A0A3D0KBE8_9GAMM|nr:MULTISPECIES: thioredoxin domain-containing protein [Halomonas]HCA00784.1 hypothetical protein [Halomonas campaniensis]